MENIDTKSSAHWFYNYHRLFAAVANHQPFAIAEYLHARQLAGYAALVTKHVTLSVSLIIKAVLKVGFRQFHSLTSLTPLSVNRLSVNSITDDST